MPRAARVDANHGEVAGGLRSDGCRVLSLAPLGGGAPDLLIGTPIKRRLALLEVKDGRKPPSKRKLRPDQVWFAAVWAGYPLRTVGSLAEARAFVAELDQ